MIFAVHSDTLPLTTVDDYAENILVQQMSRVDGVGQVSLGGQQKPAIRIQVDPAKMANMGIQLTDVESVIQTATVDSPKGSVNGTLHSFAIYDNDQLITAKPWNDVIVAYRNGAPVRIRDIGTAVRGAENTQMAAYQNGRPGVILMIFKQPGANVIDTVRRVKQILPSAMASMPPGIKLDLINDRTITINASVHDVEFTLMTDHLPGRARDLSLPAQRLGDHHSRYHRAARAVRHLRHDVRAGYSLDNLSLMGLTIAVGFVVDDAIVMLENIYRHIEAGMSPLEASLQGAGEIGFTIMSISLSLIAVFIPLLLMGGIVGRLFREFAITVTLTIVVSAFVALTLSPMMCSLFLRNEHNVRHGRFYQASERVFDRSLALYERGLDFVLARQGADAHRVRRHHRTCRHPLRGGAQGLLPAGGHEPDQRHHRRLAGHLLHGDEQEGAAVDGGRLEGPGRLRVDGIPRRRPPAQQRLHHAHAEAARSAQGERGSDHPPAAPEARQSAGRDDLPAVGPGRERRRTDFTHPVPVHPAGRQPR